MKTQTLLALICLSLLTPTLFGQTNAPADSTNAVTTPPPIPEEARKHFVMGTTLFKDAKTPDDYLQVESEFKQAADLAPQWPDARYNLALAKEAAGDYSGAMADLKLYQKFKLSDTEARTVQDKIYVLEAKQEKKASDAAAKAAADAANVQAEADSKKNAFIKSIQGDWRVVDDRKVGGTDGASLVSNLMSISALENGDVKVTYSIRGSHCSVSNVSVTESTLRFTVDVYLRSGDPEPLINYSLSLDGSRLTGTYAGGGEMIGDGDILFSRQ